MEKVIRTIEFPLNKDGSINWSIRKENGYIEDHDCHLSPEDSCDCQDI